MPAMFAAPLVFFTCLLSSAPPPPQSFAAFVDAYFDALFTFSPSLGTAAGFHQYDTQLEDRSSANIGRRIATLRVQLGQLNVLRRGTLTSPDSIDAAMLDGAIRAEILDEETIGNWRRNPIVYVSLGGNAVDLLMKRNFAPPAERLKSVTARLAGIPTVLQQMRTNVARPPKEFTDIAIRVSRGSVGFFQNDVARWARESAGTDSAALAAFTLVNDSVVKAMTAAADWLEKDLSKRSTGTFAIGAKAFAEKLLYEEMIDVPLDRMLALGEQNLREDRAAFLAVAAIVAPGKSPAQAMATLEADHPSRGALLEAARSTLEGTRQFLIDHQIVDLPSEVRPIVQETPPYARVGTFASMDTPGAFESTATEAFYYVTPVEADWDSTHAEEHLRLYNRAVMNIITIHEAFPGHYLQFLYVKQFPTKTRKLLYANSNVEGWAHYGEEMMVEQGFGGNDPRTQLAQLQEALLRDCRWVAGIKEHTQGLSVADAAKQYFTDQCFQLPANAFEEARRGAYDPTYLYYSFGKLAIYKLRADYRSMKGDSFTLRDFHDRFAQEGGIPLKLMRRILIPGDTASVL